MKIDKTNEWMKERKKKDRQNEGKKKRKWQTDKSVEGSETG